MAARAFGDDRDLGANIGRSLIIGHRLTMFIDPRSAGADADDLAVLKKHLMSAEAWENLHAFFFRDLGKPADDFPQRNDITSLAGHVRRMKREGEGFILREK